MLHKWKWVISTQRHLLDLVFFWGGFLFLCLALLIDCPNWLSENFCHGGQCEKAGRAGIGGDIMFTAVLLRRTITGPGSLEGPNERRSLCTVAQVGKLTDTLAWSTTIWNVVWIRMWSDDWGWQSAFHQPVGWLGRCWPLENFGLRETELSFFLRFFISFLVFFKLFFYFYF